MARKKNAEPVELKLGTEDTQVINSADIEAKEAELLTEDAESESEEKIEVAEEPKVQDKPKRQRRSRKAPEAAITAAPNESLDKEVALAHEAVQAAMSTMLQQFTAIKDITNTLNGNLEKMTGLIREMSPNESPNLEELVKPETNYSFISKFATAASLVAVLFSVLSLSMSQSARQSALSNEMNRVSQSDTYGNNAKYNADKNEIANLPNEYSVKKTNRNIKGK